MVDPEGCRAARASETASGGWAAQCERAACSPLEAWWNWKLPEVPSEVSDAENEKGRK